MGKFRCSSPANNLSFLVRGTWSQTGPGTCLEPSSDSTTTTRTDRKGFHPRRCAQSRILLPWLASRKQTYDYCLWMFNVRMFPKSSVQVLVTMETRLEPNAIAIWHELRNADAWKKTWNFGKAENHFLQFVGRTTAVPPQSRSADVSTQSPMLNNGQVGSSHLAHSITWYIIHLLGSAHLNWILLAPALKRPLDAKNAS